MNRTAVGFVLATIALQSTAQDSAAYARMARATSSAFECSALAAKLKKPAEQERLFNFGYGQGKEFMAALQAGNVKQEDLSANAPVGMLLRLEGPTPDFMLGRVYAAAEENALENVYRVGDRFNSKEEQALAASAEFESSNCELIGNAR